jgi:peptidoglycan lytic transglycosylase G
MAGTDPAELGVPAWAQEAVARAEPVRRLEGLIAPGVHDVEPGAPAVDVLRTLVTDSTDELAPLVSGAEAAGEDPYEVLVVASLVEKEGITADMPRVARVVYNRLSDGQRLELDSTVNYPLDLQALATTDDDRARPGPYNTYRTGGLPPTPIAAVGADAIAAALDPEPGPWRYFVKCQTDGTSCFAETFPEHQDNIATARANGAF